MTDQNSVSISVPIRVFVITGHQILMWGLQQLIKSNELTMQLVGSASSSADAITAITATSPDIIVIDLDTHDGASVDIPTITADSHARVLAMTISDDPVLQDKPIHDGARGLLNSHASPEAFIEAIIKVHHGQLWLDRAATGRIFVALSQKETNNHLEKQCSKLLTLTPSEKKIVFYISQNSADSARTIAQKMHISESTLRNHLTSIYGKLGISNRFELIAYTQKNSDVLTLF